MGPHPLSILRPASNVESMFMNFYWINGYGSVKGNKVFFPTKLHASKFNKQERNAPQTLLT